MAIYQRMTMVNAVKFIEQDYLKNRLSYPEVWDRAMFSELWFNRQGADGRYYITNQPNTFGGATEYTTVNDGDYIIREEMGITYTLPEEFFEKHYEKLSK